MDVIPDRPAMAFFQKVSTPIPMGETMPRPVTTTRVASPACLPGLRFAPIVPHSTRLRANSVGSSRAARGGGGAVSRAPYQDTRGPGCVKRKPSTVQAKASEGWAASLAALENRDVHDASFVEQRRPLPVT